MIHFISGKPRAGKSYYAVMQVCAELRNSERGIVTNLPLDLEALDEWCRANISREIDLGRRLRILTDDETPYFWLYDVCGFDNFKRITWQPKAIPGRPPRPSVSVPDMTYRQTADYAGCLYVIDEAHIHFPSRRFYHDQAASAEAEYVFSQHGHMRMDIILISQNPEKVDRNMRRDAQDFTLIRNMGNERLWMGVRVGKLFRRATFPEMPGPGDRPMETGTFRLRVEEYGKLYATSAGVGLAGRVDTKERVSGRSPLVWLVAAAAVVLVAVLVPQGIGALSGALVKGIFSGVRSGVSGISEVAGKSVPALTNAVAVVPASVVTNAGRGPGMPPGARMGKVGPQFVEGLEVVGLFRGVAGAERVCLSDGRVLRSEDGFRVTVRPGLGVEVLGVGLVRMARTASGSGAAVGPGVASGGGVKVPGGRAGVPTSFPQINKLGKGNPMRYEPGA